MFRSQDIQAFAFLTIHDLPNQWHHDEIMKPQNLVSW